MAKQVSRPHVYAPNSSKEPISGHDLIRGFLLDLGASGRAARTVEKPTETMTTYRP